MPRNYIVYIAGFSSLIAVVSLLAIGNIWGQSETEDELMNITTPSSIQSSVGELGNSTMLKNVTTKNNLMLRSSPLSFAQNTVSCLASSNPCIGTDDSDFMLGDAGINSMEGRKGDDIMGGNDADDKMYGNEGTDEMQGNNGNDYMNGGQERDRIFGGLGDDKIEGGDGPDYMLGEGGKDNMKSGQGQNTMLGGADDDAMTGDVDSDILIGNAGSDIIFGLGGNDVLFHSDSYSGSSDGQRDLIYCGDGYDEVWVNKLTDNDAAYDCEKIHEKDEPIVLDPDSDAVPTSIDNCPIVPNNSQMDRDQDGLGDACDPYPSNSNMRTNKVTVKFDSITVHNDHEGFGRGDGEYNLVAYVQGYRIKLTEATEFGVCGGITAPDHCDYELWDVDSGQTVYFEPDTDVSVEIADSIPLSIFTLGDEVDGCMRTPYPSSEAMRGHLNIFSNPQLDWRSQIQSYQTRSAASSSCSLGNDNDVLGALNEFYDPPSYNGGPHQIKSSNADFTLRYTITVFPK